MIQNIDHHSYLYCSPGEMVSRKNLLYILLSVVLKCPISIFFWIYRDLRAPVTLWGIFNLANMQLNALRAMPDLRRLGHLLAGVMAQLLGFS